MARTRRYNRDISSKDSVLEAARKAGESFDLKREASPELQQDRDVVLAALQAQGINLQHCDERTRADRDLVWTAVSSNGLALRYCDERFRADRDLACAAVSSNGKALQHCAEELRNDRSLVQTAVANHGPSIAHANESLRCVRELAVVAVSRCGSALEYLCEELRDDREIVMMAIRTGVQQSSLIQHWVLAPASERMRGDREIVQAAIEHLGGEVLMHAALLIQEDRSTVLSAVQSNGLALEFAADDLRADRDLVLEAVARHGGALQFASPGLQGDKEVVLSAIRAPDPFKRGVALKYASKELQDDRDVVMEAVMQAGGSITFASPSVLADREVVEVALANSAVRASVILRVAAPALRADRSIVHSAIKDDSLSLLYASEDLQMDPDTVALAWATMDNDHDFDLFHNFGESSLSKLYATKAANLRKLLSLSVTSHALLDFANPHAMQQRADDWLKELVEKKLLLRELIKRRELAASLFGYVESFAGMNEDAALACAIAQFGAVLFYTKRGLVENFEEDYWDTLVRDATGSTNA